MKYYGKIIGVSNIPGEPYYEIYHNELDDGGDEYYLVYLDDDVKEKKVVRLFCGTVVFESGV